MIKVKVRMHTADGHMDFAAGEAFYWGPGHAPEALEDSEYVDFSPTEERDRPHHRRSRRVDVTYRRARVTDHSNHWPGAIPPLPRLRAQAARPRPCLGGSLL